MSSHKKLDANKQLDAKELDKIVEKIIDTVHHSKDEIFTHGAR